MPKRGLPQLSESAKFYVENTLRARIRSAGLERYTFRRPSVALRAVAVLAAVAGAIAALAWLALR